MNPRLWRSQCYRNLSGENSWPPTLPPRLVIGIMTARWIYSSNIKDKMFVHSAAGLRSDTHVQELFHEEAQQVCWKGPFSPSHWSLVFHLQPLVTSSWTGRWTDWHNKYLQLIRLCQNHMCSSKKGFHSFLGLEHDGYLITLLRSIRVAWWSPFLKVLRFLQSKVASAGSGPRKLYEVNILSGCKEGPVFSRERYRV